MKRLVLLLCAVVTFGVAGCGDDPAAAPAPTPAPQHSVPPGVLPPVDRTHDTVDKLEDLQNRTEQQTGGGVYAP
jgi:hypothetical protein